MGQFGAGGSVFGATAGAEPGNFHVLLSHVATLELSLGGVPKKAKGKWRKGRGRGRARAMFRRDEARKSPKRHVSAPRANRARFAAKTRRIGEGCRADEEGCSTRSTHLFAMEGRKNGGPTPSSHAAVRRRRTSGLPVKATQVSLAVSRARKGDNRPIRESARTPPTYTPDRFRCAKNYGAGSRTFLPGKKGRS